MMVAMRLPTQQQVQLTKAMHLFITTQGTAAIEGTALGDDDQTPQARPTQAIGINATTGTDITVDPDPERTAIHYTLDCAEDDPTLTDGRQGGPLKSTASSMSPSTTTSHRRHWSPRDVPSVHTGTTPSTSSGTTPLPYTRRR